MATMRLKPSVFLLSLAAPLLFTACGHKDEEDPNASIVNVEKGVVPAVATPETVIPQAPIDTETAGETPEAETQE